MKNDKLETELAELLNKANNGIDNIANLAVEQLPDVLQQALTWGLFSSLGVFLFQLLIAIGIFLYWYIPYKNKWESLKCEDFYIPYYGIGILFIISFGIIVNNLSMQWLQILIAPKVWLIEYAGKLVG